MEERKISAIPYYDTFVAPNKAQYPINIRICREDREFLNIIKSYTPLSSYGDIIRCLLDFVRNNPEKFNQLFDNEIIELILANFNHGEDI